VDPVDIEEELHRWRASGLPPETQKSALRSLRRKLEHACEEQKNLIDTLTRELVYSLCWPQEIGEDTLVSRAYRLLGPTVFPIPDDPDPIRLSLEIQEDRLQHLNGLLSEIDALVALIEANER
jgi:hypothetical protein